MTAEPNVCFVVSLPVSMCDCVSLLRWLHKEFRLLDTNNSGTYVWGMIVRGYGVLGYGSMRVLGYGRMRVLG